MWHRRPACDSFSSFLGVVANDMNNSFKNRPKTQDLFFSLRGVHLHMADSPENEWVKG
jgi:hypothetical protein